MTPERFKRLTDVLNKRQPDITVVLENVFDPHNVSAVMRTCDAIGIQEVYILNNRIPPHKKWGYRSSSTAAEWLTIHQFTDLKDCFKSLREKYAFIYASDLQPSSQNLFEMDLTQNVALVFGNERYGVGEEVRAFCDGSFIIPQVGIIKSLNISVACAVTLYEAFRQKTNAGHYLTSRLPLFQMDGLQKSWGINDQKK